MNTSSTQRRDKRFILKTTVFELSQPSTLILQPRRDPVASSVQHNDKLSTCVAEPFPQRPVAIQRPSQIEFLDPQKRARQTRRNRIEPPLSSFHQRVRSSQDITL
ncbi:hypothetical protein ONS96_004870 [Cadophora gregata f. sp. sojae]|nr:hypothetical protein ONS96_004870 [Cadophora gregata f. sp. sojae]